MRGGASSVTTYQCFNPETNLCEVVKAPYVTAAAAPLLEADGSSSSTDLVPSSLLDLPHCQAVGS
jgi:hypothetical protein